jgi:hypothetical protein
MEIIMKGPQKVKINLPYYSTIPCLPHTTGMAG